MCFWHKNLFRASVAVLFAALSLGLASCEKDPSGGKDKAPVVQAEKTVIGRAGDEVFIKVSATGEWTVRVEFPGGEAPWASVSPEKGSVYGTVLFKAEANSGEDARTARVVVSATGGTASVTITQSGIGGGSPSGTAAKWLELPETPDGQGCLFGAHDMQGNVYQSGQRNWSCWWSPTHHISRWVAYPLNNALKGSGNRTEAWGLYDPCFSIDDQPNLGATYGGGWTRGHQIPSADRLKYGGSDACNQSTYYPTNMTPQDYDFNSGRWATLEGNIRKFAGKCDTLYVVTGCEYDPAYGTTGNQTGFRVTIPSAYWKAVIALKKSPTEGFFGTSSGGYYAGCAFFLEHTQGESDKHKNYISIDALEALIGIDLFVNLPDKIGADKAAKVEQLSPGDFWN